MENSTEIKKLLLEWLLKNSFMGAFNLSSNSSYWEYYDMSLIGNPECYARSKTDNPIKKDEILKQFDNIDLYTSREKWETNGFAFESLTQITHAEDLFYSIYNQLNENDKDSFLTLGDRFLSFHRMILIFKKDKEVFSRYMKITPKPFVELLRAKHVEELFELLKTFYKNDSKTYTNLLFEFLNNRKRQVKRIEVKTLALHAVKTYAEDKDKFSSFFTDIIGDSYLLPSSTTIPIKISKNLFFNLMTSGGQLFERSAVTSYLHSFVYYLSKKEKKRLNLNHTYLLNHDNGSKHYIVILDCVNESKINYEDMLSKTLDKCKEAISRHDKHDFFKKGLDYYFLEKAIPSKQDLPKKISKI